MAADAGRQSGSQGDQMSETNREYAANYRKPPLDTRFKKGQSGNPTVGPRKTCRGF